MAVVVGLFVSAGVVGEILIPDHGGGRVVFFIASTLLCSAALVIWGRRPWRFAVELFDWLPEPPPGTAIISCHVASDDRDQAARILRAAGFAYIEEDRSYKIPDAYMPDFPITTLKAWDVGARGSSHNATRAHDALKQAGIRVASLTGAAVNTW